MTECQGCGAWNERHRTLCVLCGTPLAETDEWDAATELPPLPPLPDGGLSVTMPAWLRAMPGNLAPDEPPSTVFLAAEEEPAVSVPTLEAPSAEDGDAVATAGSREPTPQDVTPADQLLGPQADPRTFLRDEDFPHWIRELPPLPPRPVLPVTVVAAPVMEPTTLAAPPANPVSPQELHAVEEVAELSPVPEPAPTGPSATDSAARRRDAWETPLLVVLVVGVVVAVIWALLVNGLIGRGL